MARILIVDDEVKIREVVREYAEVSGYDVKEAKDGREALELVEREDFDVIVLDIMMPYLDGFSACRQIKKIKNIPIIMLSARQEEFDKLFGFELGVDDYVVKPFSPKELMARIKVVIDRHTGKENQTMAFNGLNIDVDARNVFINGEKVNLTPKEFDLLLFLVRNKNTALSRDVLLDKVWNYNYFGDDRTVDTHIKMLRHNLGEYRDYIVTVRGTGYKFEVQ
ncbi:MAG: DNA-binding response regulator [Firmicutes bacterium GWF2_51_9]|nr:MAG: DNA-binding response regulator [Firmicutes bacterium GWF2_51_9]OGS59036.1 MAG: DNA-binding response regulator [Firmicutes bacterium GWE2_51_13]HAM62846.1 DNA-binding response regulator [Erysipelotrichaceae bacterium]HBZ40678.1 DNA-binding response regulator [Erysipelotrichaceae bacterium]